MPHKRVLQVGVMIAGALLLVTATLKSQAPARSAQVWEYSSITGWPTAISGTNTGINSWTGESKARICYATSQGCRNEEVTATITDSRRGAEAIMLAAAKLGEQGWELTASTEALTNSTYNTDRILYFRRLKPDPK